MYPFRFTPLFKRYIWGGRRLASVLNKPIGEESCAESWEIVDHNENQSIVAFGDLAGTSLAELISSDGDKLLGPSVMKQITDKRVPKALQNRFPLLLKFLDANRALSVQVHPDDAFGAKLAPPDLGKTEAWYVMHADPGSKIYAGLKEGITADKFRSAVEHGFTEDALHSFEPKSGDCVFIRAGTMHAIGKGLLIAEIQQCSDTTFRVFDWNRVDKDGQSRPLHIEQSIEATNFDNGPVNVVEPKSTANENCTTIVECEKFVMRRWQLANAGATEFFGGDKRFRIFAVTKGSLVVDGDPSELALSLGETMLLPASVEATSVSTNEASEFLEIFVPEVS